MARILFVHPDQKLFQVYRPTLVSHFQLDSAHDGLSALRKLKINKPNLVVSDYRLPHLSGLALLSFIRENESYAKIPFLFLTDYEDPTPALSSGANDWLRLRDSSPDLLIEKIYHHLKLYAI